VAATRTRRRQGSRRGQQRRPSRGDGAAYGGPSLSCLAQTDRAQAPNGPGEGGDGGVGPSLRFASPRGGGYYDALAPPSRHGSSPSPRVTSIGARGSFLRLDRDHFLFVVADVLERASSNGFAGAVEDGRLHILGADGF